MTVIDLPRSAVSYFKPRLAGANINTAFPPIKMPGVVLLQDATTGDVWIKTLNDATGIPEWERIIEGGGLGLGKYWVNTAGAQPEAPYATIAAAQAAALADGHSSAAPADIYVLSQTLTENVTMFDGINVIGMGVQAGPDSLGVVNQWGCDVVLNGSVILDANYMSGSMSGIQVNGSIDLGTSPKAKVVVFRGCSVVLDFAGGFVVRSSSINNPKLQFDRCSIQNANATGKGLNLTTTHSLVLLGTSIETLTGNQTAVQMAGGARRFTGVKLLGAMVDTAAIIDSQVNADIVVSGTSALTLFAGSTVIHTGGSITGATAGSTIVGTGTITLTSVTCDGNGIGIAATVVATTSGTLRPFVEQKVGAASKTIVDGILDGDMYLFDTTGAGRTLTLPALASVPIGTFVRAGMQISGANAITVTPKGAELINGTNASVLSTATLLGSVVVVRGSTSWWVVSRS